MAGISLQLRQIIRGHTAFAWARGGAYALLVSTGPWVVSMVVVALIAKIVGGDGTEHAGFFVSVSYAQALSQILFIPLLLAFTRHLADELFQKNTRVVGESLAVALLLTPLLAAPAALVFPDHPGALQLTLLNGANAFVGACLGIFLRFTWVCLSYLAGYAVSLGGVIVVLAEGGGDADCLAGFLFGQGVLLVLLTLGLRTRLPIIRRGDFGWLAMLGKRPALPISGLALALGLWCEKFAYWTVAPDRVQSAVGLGYCPAYDLPMFLAMISATPGFAFFFLNLETGFAEAMARITDRVSLGATLDEIDRAHDDLRRSALESLAGLVRVQGGITLFGLFFAEAVLEGTGVGAVQTGIWRVVFLGVFFLVLFLAAQALLYYVNALRQAAWCSVALLVTNGALTLVFLHRGPAYHGVGFLIATALALLLALYFLTRALTRLPMRMFSAP